MHNTPHALESSGKDLQAVMNLWDICRVRLGGHVTKTEGYDINTPPLRLIFPSERSGSEEQPAAPTGTRIPQEGPPPPRAS